MLSYLKKVADLFTEFLRQRQERKAAARLAKAQAFEIKTQAKANAYRLKVEADNTAKLTTVIVRGLHKRNRADKANAAKLAKEQTRALREQTRQAKVAAKAADWARRRRLLTNWTKNSFRSLGQALVWPFHQLFVRLPKGGLKLLRKAESHILSGGKKYGPRLGRGILWPFKKLFWSWPRDGWRLYQKFERKRKRKRNRQKKEAGEKKPLVASWPNLLPAALFLFVTLTAAKFDWTSIWPHTLLLTFCAIYFWWILRKREMTVAARKALVNAVTFVWVIAWIGYYFR